MHAVVKSIASDEANLDGFRPDDAACFSLNVRIRIGVDGAPGEDDFELCVCTPEWLRQTIWEPRWGRHMLIVREYDRSVIEKYIHDYVVECAGADWNAIAGKLARVFSWEFEDYQG
ncbi:immunity 8 family protein [Ralstonia pseudosolanacearum]|uniref:Immunity protein 8 of polymorphic toxin system n=1 Tax=Ralstonia solanacearum TaxID=305 RepID=A0A0S4U0H2_RALSL|nr:conserved protein of unknown function [Ralstonia solanacearum]